MVATATVGKIACRIASIYAALVSLMSDKNISINMKPVWCCTSNNKSIRPLIGSHCSCKQNVMIKNYCSGKTDLNLNLNFTVNFMLNIVETLKNIKIKLNIQLWASRPWAYGWKICALPERNRTLNNKVFKSVRWTFIYNSMNIYNLNKFLPSSGLENITMNLI